MNLRNLAVVCASLLPLLSCGGGPAELSEAVSLLRLPEGARLPRAAVDGKGTMHVVYFQGEPRAGDLLHVSRAAGAADWSEPRHVNSEPGTVVGIGPIDGGQIALGKDGRLHVTWFKLGRTEFLYTRTDEAGTGFEPQFAIAAGEGVEAGPSIAADRAGNVYVFWHTGAPPRRRALRLHDRLARRRTDLLGGAPGEQRGGGRLRLLRAARHDGRGRRGVRVVPRRRRETSAAASAC